MRVANGLAIVLLAPTHGELAQLGERVTGSHEVRGSNPLFSTTFCQRLRIQSGASFRLASFPFRSLPKSTFRPAYRAPFVDLGRERTGVPQIAVKLPLVANHDHLFGELALRASIEASPLYRTRPPNDLETLSASVIKCEAPQPHREFIP